MNYYEHHLGDWAAATGHLTWDEDMAYTRLLRAYYHAEKAIPEGQQYRLAKASTPAQRKAVDAVLVEFFVLEQGAFHQKRADQEIDRFLDKQRKAKASANARWSHTERNANASPNAMRTHSEGNALQAPDTIPKQEEKEKPRKRVTLDVVRPEDVAEQVWNDWVKLRKGKRAAVSATVVTEARREADKASLTLERFLAVWCARGSQGLEADWLKPHERGTAPQSSKTSFTRDREAQASAWMGSAAPQSGEIIDMEQSNVTRLAVG